jgi:UDP-glucuronate 4-epimerase
MELHCNKEAIKEYHPMQAGDVYQTYADISKLQNAVGYQPKVNINEGLEKFVKWFKQYYKY